MEGKLGGVGRLAEGIKTEQLGNSPSGKRGQSHKHISTNEYLVIASKDISEGEG